MTSQPFTFASLDGLAFAEERDRLKEFPPGTLFDAQALGPFIELTLMRAAGRFTTGQPDWLRLSSLAPFATALRNGEKRWIHPNGSSGFFKTSEQWTEDDTDWVGFGLAVQKAAGAAGFHRRVAAQFAASLGELVSNVHEHCGAPDSGIAAFNAVAREFEFTVADAGIGMLASLVTCPDYEGLSDQGQALRLALSDGVSRHGPAAKRGGGFRPIFIGLANLSGALRFRSGDHALVMDGQQIGALAAKVAQKTNFKGFLASVACGLG